MRLVMEPGPSLTQEFQVRARLSLRGATAFLSSHLPYPGMRGLALPSSKNEIPDRRRIQWARVRIGSGHGLLNRPLNPIESMQTCGGDHAAAAVALWSSFA